jgi:apolipoprotein N-acyltransferase
MHRLPTRRRLTYLLALGVGVLEAASFPKIGLSWLAWLVPGALVVLGTGESGAPAFRIGYVAGLAHYLVSLYWLLLIPMRAQAIMAWLAVGAILALYRGAWTWVCWRLCPVRSSTRTQGARELIRELNWRQAASWSFLCACAWVAMEMGIARILTGFPWDFLGVSQFKILPLIQMASITGVYGVSFLMVWTSVSVAVAGARALTRPASLGCCAADLAVPATVLVGVLWFGWYRLAQAEPVGRELTVALVQPSIPQLVIWDDREKANRFSKLVTLSQEAITNKPQLLVWPEAALPNVFTRFNPRTYEAVTNLVMPNRLWMIFGADDAEPRKNPRTPDEIDFFNSALLVAPTGQLTARYHKRRLVMFGEYMPLPHWFPFLKYLRKVEGGFTPGAEWTPFELAGVDAKISVLICFEDVFPQLVRRSVTPDTDFVLNLTNNGWFGESAAQWQHAVSALFRAVENDRPLVRCTNNGLTCWIDGRGRLHDTYFPGSKDIYGPGFKLVRVPLRPRGAQPALTIYGRYGDWFGWSCIIVVAIALCREVMDHRRLTKTLSDAPPRAPY